MNTDNYIDAETFSKITDKNIRALASVAIRLAADTLGATQFNTMCMLLNGATVEEIAEQTHRKDSAVRATITKATKLIRQKLVAVESIKQFENSIIAKKDEEINSLRKELEVAVKSAKEENKTLISSLKAEITSLSKENSKLLSSLNKIRYAPISKLARIAIDDIVENVKTENIELRTSIEEKNRSIKDLENRITKIRKEGILLDYMYEHYNRPEDFYDTILLGKKFDINLSDLGLSYQTMKFLNGMKISKLGKLCSYSEWEISKAKGCSEDILNELHDILGKFDLHLGMWYNKHTMELYNIYKKAKREFEKKYPIEGIIANEQKE